MQEKFKYTEASRDELRHARLNIAAYVCLVLYIIVLALLIWHFSQSYRYSGDWLAPLNWTLGVLLLMASNLLLFYPLGSLTIRAIVFPYSFWGASRYIIGEGSHRYSDDFKQILSKCCLIMHVKLLAKGGREQETFYFGSPFIQKLRE